MSRLHGRDVLVSYKTNRFGVLVILNNFKRSAVGFTRRQTDRVSAPYRDFRLMREEKSQDQLVAAMVRAIKEYLLIHPA